MMDKTAPADHNPVFVLNKKDIEETLKEPRVIISRVDSEGDKLKVYMHIVDGENLLTGAEGMKEIFCTTIDEMNGNEKILNNFTIKEISEENCRPSFNCSSYGSFWFLWEIKELEWYKKQ